MLKLLAAVDLSTATDAVVDHAARLCRAASGDLTLLHVAAPDSDFVSYDVGPPSVRTERSKAFRSHHRALQARARQLRALGLSATALMTQGAIVEEIVHAATRLDVDIIVVGSHGHGPLYRAFLGSVSEGVLRRASHPVLIVPCAPKPVDNA